MRGGMRLAQLWQPRRVRLLRAIVALAAIAAACGSSASVASAKVVVDPATHQRFSIVPALGGASPAAAPAGMSCSTDCTALLYHNGPVQHGEHDYLFFWFPTGYTLPAAYESGLQSWLNNVAAAAGTAGNPFSVDTLYYDNSGTGGTASYVPYAVQDAGTIVDTDPYPASVCTDTDASNLTEPVCLTDAQIQTELSSYITAHSDPKGINTQYFVLTPQGVGSCFDSSSSSCSYTAFCGYHSYIGSGSSQIVYANLPWAYQVPGCDVNDAFGAGYPNAGGIDPVVSVFSHELSETMTDPNLNAWYDSSGNEIGDKCAYDYGPGGYGSVADVNYNGSGYWNIPLGSGDYLMQLEYDQRTGDCEAGLTNTWTGAAAPASSGWSHASSWAGALAPAGALDTLVFPALTSGACTSVPVSATCYTTADDVSGLSANGLMIDDGVGYSIAGDAVTLGAGGIAATTASNSPAGSTWTGPLTLSAGQTWTVGGGPSGGGGLSLGGAVSGAGDALQVNLSSRAGLSLGADDEVGAVTVSGAAGGDSGGNAGQNGTLTATRLNATDGHAVTLDDVALLTAGSAATGPLTSTGASVQVGQGSAGALSVNGGLSLDSASELSLYIDGAGTTAGSDFSQISATGAISLAGGLELASGTSGCPTLFAGQADTLITTTGSLSGTFTGVPNGAVVTLACGSGAPSVEINYTAHAVTATALSSAPFSLTAPTITGSAEPGQSLSGSPGTWANSPTSVVDQWERCDATGANCSPVGTTGQPYALTGQDVGDTIRIEETATNTTGSTTVWSTPTVVVEIPGSPASPSSPSPLLSSPGPAVASPASSAPATTASSQTQTGASAAQIRASLLGILASAGRPSSVSQLLNRGTSYAVSINAPGPGTVVVSWATRPAKRSAGRRSLRASTTVVASGRARVSGSGPVRITIRLTAQGRRLLAHNRTLSLTVTVTFTSPGSAPVTVVKSVVLRS